MSTVKENVANICRLSPLQEAMLATATAGGSAAYQDQVVLHLRGRVRADLLAAAWNALVARHEALRTSFVTRPGQPPLQLILHRRDVVMREADLTGRDAADQEGELAALRSGERERPFDLRHDPLLRLLLCRLSAERWALIWTFHHIALDGWSKGVLLRELVTLYAANVSGRAPELPPPMPYRSFVRWLEAQDEEAALRHWRGALAGLRGPTGLPPGRHGHGYRVEELTVTLDGAATAAVQALGARNRVTPSALLQAAWALVVARHSGSDDVVFGTVTAGRGAAIEGIEQAVGLFVQTLPVRLRIGRDERLLDLAARAQRATLEGARVAPLGLAAIARACGVSRVVDHLVDVINYPFDLAAMLDAGGDAGLGFEKVEALDQSDLDLNVFATFDGELRLTFNYNAEVYAGEQLAAAGEHLLDLLRDAVAAPTAALGSAALLSRDERQRLDAARNAPLPAVGDRQPLSPHQERLCFIDRFERGTVYPAAPTYHNVPLLLRLRGALDVDRLSSALGALARRHQALRLRLRSGEGGELFQEVAGEASLPLRLLPPAGELPAALAAALRWAAEPFDLEGGALVAAGLLPLRHDEHLLLLALHHAIVDAPSLAVLARDLARLYDGEARDEHGASPGWLPVAAWERAELGAVEELALAHWRRHLADLPVLVLPTDRPRAAVHTFTAQRTTFEVPTDLTRRLLALADSEVNLSALLLAGFAALLARYSGQTDVVLGTSDPRRARPELAEVVGPLANLLVLRLDVQPSASFAELARRAARELASAREHGDLPFDRLVTALQPQKDMTRTALFDVLFTCEEIDRRTLSAGSLAIERLDTNLGWGKYDFALGMRHALADDGSRRLHGELVSNHDHHDPATAGRLVEHFLNLLAGLAAAPAQASGRVSCLGAEERQTLVAESVPAPCEFPRSATLASSFGEQAARHPDRIAVVAGDHALSYGALARRAGKLAARLRRHGVGPESRVGLLLERDADTIVAIFAVLVAGGAYVPLDGDLPRARLHWLLQDASIELVLTTSALQPRLADAAGDGAPVACLRLDDLDAAPAPPPRAPRHAGAALPRNLAYLIYTSGSTGLPKGVMVEHRQVVRLITHEAPLFDFCACDVWTLCHSTSFDFSVWEIFAPLLTGGRVVVVPRHVVRDSEALLALLGEQKVTVLDQTPSAFANLSRAALAARDAGAAASLRYVIFGGEALQPRSLADWLAAHPGARAINMYGITETTVHVTHKRVGDAEVAGNVCNVGRPIPTLGVALLDEAMELVPSGAAGELCVSGEGVTRGYLGRPGLTADRFRPHPFDDGERLYRSGDLARRLDGGELLYLGRRDHQVKVRGFRIELGEIEHRLLEHPRVSAAAVLAATSGAETRLVAYLVAAAELSVEELRAHLAERLPEHMLPARFVRLARLPLTATGKIDRRVLAAMPGEQLDLGSRFMAPRDVREAALQASFREVLQRAEVGVHDSYFALGGDSIKAIQVAARLRQRGWQLRIQDLFQHPTIAALAPRLATVEEAPAAATRPAGERGEVPLTPVQRWFFAAFPERPERFAHNVLLRLERRRSAAEVERALAGIVRHHPALALTFTRGDGRWRQWQGEPAERHALEVAPLPGGEDWQARLERIAEAALGRLDLAVAPWRVTLVHADAADYLLLFVHHLVTDGVSWRILLEDFAAALEQAGRGEPVVLPAEATTFAQWAARAAASPAAASEAAHWQQVEGWCRQLPVDFPAGSNRFGDGAAEIVEVPVEVAAQLLGPANRAYRTSPEDLLLAALARALRAWPGGERLVVTLEGHGRAAAAGELARTVGWFTTRFPFALELDHDGIEDAVVAIKEALGRVPAGGAGYGGLRYPAGDGQSLAPEPAVSFNYLGDVDLAGKRRTFTVVPALSAAAGVDAGARRPSELDASAVAYDGRLELTLAYSRERLRATTVAALAQRWARELRAVVEHCAARPDTVTVADLSWSAIGREDLEGITS